MAEHPGPSWCNHLCFLNYDALRLASSTESIHVSFVLQSKGQLTAVCGLPEAQPESPSQGRLRGSAWVHTSVPRQVLCVGLFLASRFTPLCFTEDRVCSCAAEAFHIKQGTIHWAKFGSHWGQDHFLSSFQSARAHLQNSLCCMTQTEDSSIRDG